MPRILFLLKRREQYWGSDPTSEGASTLPLSSGLTNSVAFVVAMLNSYGIEAKAVQCTDNNDIDREVTAYQPTYAIVEAFWVVPEKFDVLKPLHPHVQWIVRNHSEVAFLANEGIGFEWIAGYLNRGVEVMCNAPRALNDLQHLAVACGLPAQLITYGLNHYPVPGTAQLPQPASKQDGYVHVGLFGAIRPLKNHTTQAIAALQYAQMRRQPLKLHINASRVEGGGDPILKNLRSLFGAAKRHQLIEHPWMPHAEFCDLVGTMDICLQVSFSETFNIVTADAVSRGVPVVTSSEVGWLGSYAYADPTDSSDIAAKMYAAHDGIFNRARAFAQQRNLVAYCRESEQAWTSRFGRSTGWAA